MKRWSLEFADDQGIAGSLRLTVEGTVASFHAQVVVPDVGVVVVRDDEVAPPKRQDVLVVRAEGLWVELLCETPGEHWSIGLEAFGVRLDGPDDALHGEIGERIALGFDFEWETTGESFRSELGGVAHEEQPGVVHG